MKYLLVLILLMPVLYSEGQVSDNFTDGNFTENPDWTGDTGKFEINSLKQLHLTASGTGQAILATPNGMINKCEWSFWIMLSFNTSTNNYARIYLVSDHEDLKGSLNGYFLQIGGSNDSVSFFRQSGNQFIKLFTAEHSCTNSSSNVLRFKIIHDSAGIWTLYADNSGGSDFVKEGFCSDSNLQTTSWFGVYCQYTSSNSTKFYFDDFYVGTVKTDTSYEARARDIIIDEIMADPTPSNGLPESEYVELYNRTLFPVELNGWSFEYGSSEKTLPAVTLSPHEYLILTGDSLLNSYGTCVNIFSSNSALSNEGTTLILKNASGKIIHSVAYSSNWYQNSLKENGGWSLEMIDPDNPCGCQGNWKASINTKGGTPGSINSVHASNPDDNQPFIKRAGIISDSTILLEFSEPMDSLSLNDLNQWALNKDGFTPIKVSPIPPGYISVLLTLHESLEKHIIYYLSCRDNLPEDCAGNSLDTIRTVRVGLPDSILPGDIVINEILPNPETGGEKFIELYNRSEKVLDLHELAVGLYDSIQNTGSDLKPVSENGILSFPGDYSVLTKDPDDIQKRYYCPDPDAFLQMSSLPSLSNDKGSVILARNNDGTLIDHITYSKDMYSDLLTTTDGVSLERINPSLASLDVTNWHSASESCGFATPGYRNSEFFSMGPGKDMISLLPSVFTPDNDGKDDVLVISFTPDEPGYLADISIFDASGHLVRSLIQNRLLSTEDAVMWDGRDDKNLRSPLGIYILIIDLFKPDGKAYHLKKTCILGGKR